MSFCIALTDTDWSLTKDVFSVAGTLVTAAGVGIAFYFGREGLATWRRQLRGTANHELARRALIELFQYRESVERARSPLMFESEMALPEDLPPESSFLVRNYLAKIIGYQNRLEAIRAARAPVHASLIEAEAIWGRELKGLFKPLFSLEFEFNGYVSNHLMALDPRKDQDDRKAYSDLIRNKPNVMYGSLSEEGDDFKKQFDLGVLAIENYLRPKLA